MIYSFQRITDGGSLDLNLSMLAHSIEPEEYTGPTKIANFSWVHCELFPCVSSFSIVTSS